MYVRCVGYSSACFFPLPHLYFTLMAIGGQVWVVFALVEQRGDAQRIYHPLYVADQIIWCHMHWKCRKSSCLQRTYIICTQQWGRAAGHWASCFGQFSKNVKNGFYLTRRTWAFYALRTCREEQSTTLMPNAMIRPDNGHGKGEGGQKWSHTAAFVVLRVLKQKNIWTILKFDINYNF